MYVVAAHCAYADALRADACLSDGVYVTGDIGCAASRPAILLIANRMAATLIRRHSSAQKYWEILADSERCAGASRTYTLRLARMEETHTNVENDEKRARL